VPGFRPVRVLLAAVAAVGLATALLLVLRPGAAGAAPDEPAPGADPGSSAGVAVGGVGTATGTPDVLRVTVGVEVTADGVDDALTRADEAARRVIAALGQADVPAEDV